MNTRSLSGIRPTGHIHIGNYFGAIKSWVDLADQFDEKFYCIVDQHSLTTRSDSENLSDNTLTIAASYIASGIDPKTSNIFVQSHIPSHTELAWYLSCITPMGWLNRMTQFKDKAGKNNDQSLTGLYVYPILMAADILIYNATHVPVGDDQKQHVEFARDLAQVFNNYLNKDLLVLPEPVIKKETARIMSLRDGSKKMSKSDESDYSRINLLDDDATIDLKIRKAKTDSLPIVASTADLADRPEANNLLNLYALFSMETLENVLKQFEGKLFSELKISLATAAKDYLRPIRCEMLNLLNNKDEIIKILKHGNEQANNLAINNLNEIKSAINILKIF